jgi:hypothetical protein
MSCRWTRCRAHQNLRAARPGRRVAQPVCTVASADQVPVRSVDAYFFQGRSIRNGESSRTGAGRTRIM